MNRKFFMAALLGATFSIQSFQVFASQNSSQNTPIQMPPVQMAGAQTALESFNETVAIIKKNYVVDLSDIQILNKALVGLMSELDPHSTYLNEEQYKALDIATSGEFVGVGAEVTMTEGMLQVVTPLDDSPAQKAGIKPGDYILQINKTPIQGMTLDQAMKLIRGETGTTLTLTILRKGLDKKLVLTLTRAPIKMISVKEQLIEGHYGYIRISSFQESTPKDLREAIDNLLNKAEGHQLRGLVLDLRNNPGGLLPVSIEVADDFLDTCKESHPKSCIFSPESSQFNHKDQNIIISVKGRNGESELSGEATSGDLTGGIPIVALINMGSASASEIVAAALQDHHRAVIMGEKSFGKGSIQTVIPLADGKTAVKITTARFYSPSGRPIQGEGVTPDIIVPQLNFDQNNFSSDPLDLKGVNYREMNLTGALMPERLEAISAAQQFQAQTQTQAIGIELASEVSGLPSPQTDYQLNSAVNLLKGLYAMDQTQNKTQNKPQNPSGSPKKSAPEGADLKQIADQ